MRLDVAMFWSAVALAATAAVLSLLLLIKSIRGGRLPGCGPASACDSVMTSRWSRLLGIPVALPATMVYLSMAGLLYLDHSGRARLANADEILAGLSLIAVGSAVWFILVQTLVLRRLCLWCMLAHAAGIGAAVIVLRAAWPLVQSEPRVPGIIALAPLALLIVGQLLIAPRTYAVQTPEELRPETTPAKEPPRLESPTLPEQAPAAPQPAAMPATSSSLQPLPRAAPTPQPRPTVPPRTVALLDGRLKIITSAFPLLGSADAPHVLLDMLDYTCEHCRELHHWLNQARVHFQERLAVIAVPLPMESACNPLIQTTNPKHVNACIYTKYALALWHADRAKFPEYHEWLYAPTRPPGLKESWTRAEQLVGKEAFATAMDNPAVQTQIQNALGIYKFLGAGQIPKLVMNRGVLVGQIPSLERLIEVLEDDFKPKPAPRQEQVTTTFIGGFR